jgi:hypothetical protein
MLKLKSTVFWIILILFSSEGYSQSINNNIQKLDSLASKLTQKNKIIRDVASYKIFPDNNDNITDNGYLYTKMNGYQLPLDHPLVELLDEIFYSEDQHGIILSSDKSIGYRKNGLDKSFKKGNLFREDSTVKVNIYYAQKPKSQMSTSVTKRFEIAEILILKRTNIPDVDQSEDQGEDQARRRTRTKAVKYIHYPKNMWYSLSGTNLQRALDSYDKTLYNKILRLYDERTNDLNLSPYFPLPKRGPFLVADSIGINEFTNLFTNTPIYKKPAVEETIELPELTGVEVNVLDITPFSPFVNVKSGTENTTNISLTNRSHDPIKIDEILFEKPDPAWKIKNTTIGEIQPDNSAEVEVVYNDSKSNNENRNKIIIKWTEMGSPARNVVSAVPVAGKTIPEPPAVYIDFSPMFFSGIVRFANDWNFSFKLGDEEINYPYWSTGNLKLMAGYQNIVKFGVVLPANFTNGETFDVGSIVAPQRKLHGAVGLAAEFNLQPTVMKSINDAFAIGGYFSYGKIKDGKEYTTKPLNSNNDFFYTPIVAQVYYPLIFKDLEKDPKNIFQIKAGFSYHQVKRVHVFMKSEIGTIYYGKEDKLVTKDDVGEAYEAELMKKIPSPYIKAEYMNLNGGNQFGFGFQFVNNVANFDAWLEVTNWLRIEASYVQPLRDAEEWENSSFFWISPRIYFPIH